MRHLALLATAAAALGLAATSAPARAANPAHLSNIVYDNGVVKIQLTEPTDYHTTVWRSAHRFMVDVDATGIDLRLRELPVYTSKLKTIRWNQWRPDSVRIVLDLTDDITPRVLSSPPTNVIELRISPPAAKPVAKSDAMPVRITQPAPVPTIDQRAATPAPRTVLTRPAELRPVYSPAPKPVYTPDPRPAAPKVSVTTVQSRIPTPADTRAQVRDILVDRDDSGRPERVSVTTDRPTAARASWWGNHLAIDLPDAAPGPEHIVPINDPVVLRARTGNFKGHARLVIDTTRRVNYKVSPLEDRPGVAVDLIPTPEAPAPTEAQTAPATPPVPSGPANLNAVQGRLIVLDAGHGGHDTGTRGYVTEKNVNLDVVLRLGQVLSSHGARVVYTRNDDTFIPLRARPALAMKLNADAFISIHTNYARTNHHGTEVWYRRNDEESWRLANDLYQAHRAATGFTGRGVKPESRAPQGGLAVLKHNTVPCALVEVGFANDAMEGPKLGDPAFRQLLAEALARGVARFLNGQPAVSHANMALPPADATIMPPEPPGGDAGTDAGNDTGGDTGSDTGRDAGGEAEGQG